MPECIFCKIAKKEAPAKIEYEDNDVMAFWDINPKAKIHLLIIPKRHIKSILDVKKEDMSLVCKLINVAQQLAKEKKIDKSGFRMTINTGPWSGQIVEHLHLHLTGG